MEILDIKKKDAGTYNVSATNEHGTEQVAATLIVTSIPEEAEDWKAALKHRLEKTISVICIHLILTCNRIVFGIGQPYKLYVILI